MRMRATACLALLLAAIAAPHPAKAGAFEDAVLDELNRVRANPKAYARELRRAGLSDARYGDGYGAMSQEDPDAVEDAIGFLMRQPPLPPLESDHRLTAAARSLVRNQGPRGGVGHGGQGALGRRLQSQGVYAGLSAEGISYGQDRPRDVVRQLVIDSRVPTRGHRRDVFGRAYQIAGIACGAHAEWGSMCVIDYAGAVMRR